ncbi:PAP2-domain-containing protein [Hysterangium stoloniferum]|nr:PAP2-domain-containing protein [Hysterangium stoloniferum]
MDGGGSPSASLGLSHIVYDSTSHLSLGLALMSLTPILLMPAYVVLIVQTRELLILEMWAGQMACEGLNWVLKHAIKEGRPHESPGDGYGFPSSHSQWMGYFSSFLILHLYFRHRFTSCGIWFVDKLFRGLLYLALVALAGLVCYSRYYLTYHTPTQVLWGAFIGTVIGFATYLALEYVPAHHPDSLLGESRRCLLDSRVAQWVRLRDGWAVWTDGGREEEWQRWRAEWDRTKNRGGNATNGKKAA